MDTQPPPHPIGYPPNSHIWSKGNAGRGGIGRRAAVVAALFSAGAVLADEPPKWGAHLDVEAKPGNKRSLGEMALFVPLKQDGRSLLFGNLIGRFDDHSSREANAGIGFRRMRPDGWNVGLYGFFDRRRSNYGNYFNQATVGAEALGRDWDFRANLYHPFGERIRQVDSLNTAELSSASVVFRSGEERALPGFDAEVGWRVPLFVPDDRRQLRVYLGGYRFADALTRVSGPRARVEYTVAELPNLWKGAELMLGAEAQDDNVRGGQHFVSLRLRIPFGGKERRSTLTAQERRMTAPVVRDVDIVTRAGAFGTPETVTETATGQTITVLDSATTTGAGLPTAVVNAGTNSTVILSGTFNTTATTTVQSGQTIIGSGTLAVRSPSGRTATLALSGATVSATIAGVGNYLTNTAFLMATNSTLSGLTINLSRSGGVGAVAVYANGISGATISGNTITGTETGANTGIGVLLNNATNITVSNNTITGTTGAGTTAYALGLAGTLTTVTVTGNTLNASGGSTNNYHTFINSSGINSGSTGNVKGSGTTCSSAGTITGSVSYTDGSTCP